MLITLSFRFFCRPAEIHSARNTRSVTGLSHKQLRKKLVFLTGFMGSGKSTIGPILANALGWDFVDIDKSIEQKTDQKVIDIFATLGEQAFRAFERQELSDLALREECVISLGGGTLVNDENFEFIRKNGIIVYLRLSPDKILQRVRRKTDRPLLKDPLGNLLEGDELHERIDGLLELREQYYSKADIIIPADNLKVGMTVDEIVKRLRIAMRE
jgi:shikimate kinase